MDFEIDCESKTTVFKSLCNGFSCDSNQLKKILLELDIEKIYQENWRNIDIPANEYLYKYVIKQLGNHKPLKMVNWFHLTRTTKLNKFNDGILPLGDSLDRIWSTLIEISTDNIIKNNLKSLRKNGVLDFQYSLKHNDRIHWGPYAILIKNVAFNASDLSQHDYLGMPEIIEDICNGYKEKYGEFILKNFISFLVPKIVKFQSDKCVDKRYVEAALYYAYEVVRGNPPSSNCVACFDGEGVKIEPEAIVSVITIEN